MAGSGGGDERPVKGMARSGWKLAVSFVLAFAGLLFIAYMNEPAHFVHIQSRLGASDSLNEYISHIGSGLFAVPPTPASGHYIGEQLFA